VLFLICILNAITPIQISRNDRPGGDHQTPHISMMLEYLFGRIEVEVEQLSLCSYICIINTIPPKPYATVATEAPLQRS
jgi:hypothetical protein